jgi:pimeloyl-ACP methyl ester carboxylesterase
VLLSLRGLIGTYLQRGQGTPWELAGRIEAPTLLVYGLSDKLVDPRSAYRAQRTIPNSRLVVLPDTGHVAQMERPEVVAAEVRAFLRQTSTATHSDAEASAT